MLSHKTKYKTVKFDFDDSLINADLKVLEDLCDLIIASKEVLLWRARIRIANPLPLKVLRKMAAAGCHWLSTGIESGSEQVRKHMRKPATDSFLHNQLANIHKCAIDLYAQFVIGHPSEAREDFEQTLGFVARNQRYMHSVHFNVCSLWGYSDLVKNASGYGIVGDQENVSMGWKTAENTPMERYRRWKRANQVGQQWGLVSWHDLNDKTVMLSNTL